MKDIRELSQMYIFEESEVVEIFGISKTSLENFKLFLDHCSSIYLTPKEVYYKFVVLGIELKDYIEKILVNEEG